ncbi:MAG: nodulation protein NfeD [Armatimonadetes bacterium]|nr:nodulation protein NfeD [Armatimonadota bacterium]
MLKKNIFLGILLLFFLFIPAFALDKNNQPVDVLTVKGVINPILASYVNRGIEISEKDGAICIIKMDTPGGLDQSMRIIIQKIISSAVPVVIYVYPQGGRAASAGVYILYSAHIAAMSPSTNLGAAHPVQMGKEGAEKKDDVMTQKITNDAAAFIKGLAQKHGRNISWAEKAVRESVSVTAPEAKKLKIIEIIAEDLEDLLKQIKGREIKLLKEKVVLKPNLSKIKEIKMTAVEQFLFTITDPNIAFILMMLGVYGLIYELASPGAIFPGLVGAICLILALYSLGTLPINYAGVFLIIFSFILFILDIKAPTHGALTIGGIISLILGAMMLIPAGYPYLQISKSVIFSAALISGLFFGIIITMVARGLRKKPVSGKEEIIGSIGIAKANLEPVGLVFILGELWKAKVLKGTIKEGEKVKVIKLDGLNLIVEKFEDV